MNSRLRLAFLLILPFIYFGYAVQAQGEGEVLILRASGPLTPAMAEYLDRGIQLAEEQEAEVLIFQLDTPGGQVDLMSRMIQSIRASQVPVVVYIAPRGAIAGSAGTVITLAGHVAAMAPETAIGAASPVGGQGEDLGETIEKKYKEILKGQVRSLAERRGPEAIALAEATIDEAAAASSAEAHAAGMIDLIADDLDELLLKLDGFVVEVKGQQRTLHTAGLAQVEIEQSFIEQVLQTLTNPNIVFLLITIGVQAILIEIGSPGGWVAGFIGVISIALGAYGLGALPVNWFGAIFMLTAFVLFILEIKAPTHGALTAAGLGSFIAGALILFNSPGTPDFLRVSIPLVIGTSLATASLFLVIVIFALRAQRRKVEVGSEALLGRFGIAQTDLKPKGIIHVAGELWSAEMLDHEQDIEAGKRVEVVAVEGLRLMVRGEQPSTG
jgi:membrane-bound serine protease (ClpP class)